MVDGDADGPVAGAAAMVGSVLRNRFLRPNDTESRQPKRHSGSSHHSDEPHQTLHHKATHPLRVKGQTPRKSTFARSRVERSQRE